MIKDFKALKIALASPQQILGWSYGEVKKAETINYRTHKAEVDGLMDEKIFGPTKNYECYCGKYKKIRYKGIICDKCGVEVTHKRVRRERLGHIKLAAPVTHIWYSYGVPNKLAALLNIPQKRLETVIYFSRYLITASDEEKKQEALTALEETHNKDVEFIKEEQEAEVKELKEKFAKEKKELKKKAKKNDKLELQLERLESKQKKEIAKAKSIFVQRIKAAEKKYGEQKKLIESMKEGMTLTEEENNELAYLGVDFYEAGMGAESVHKLLKKVDVNAELEQLREDRKKTKSQLKLRKIVQRLRILEGMSLNNISPEWIIINFLPVLPPDLRPIIQLPGGRFATSDLNDLYRRVINRNNRLKRLMDLGAPEIILRNEKRMLQEAVDALIDNSHRPGNPVLNSRQQAYKSLSDMLRGKQGRFRQNLLGKRVDFSGRSVIVSGPDLSVDQCGLPKTMALELFKPFVMHEIITRGLASNIKSAKNYFDERSDEVWDILEKVIDKHPVLLNRAPTLHKQGIQAFYPVLVEGNAIRLHPLVCSGFNADFDGDQMAVHVPLSQKAIKEVEDRMFPSSNILLMADGKPVINTTKDMAYGVYYLTAMNDTETAIASYQSADRAVSASDIGEIKLADKIAVLIDGKVLETTVGRIILNRALPEGYEFINSQLNKKGIAKISADILNRFGKDAAIDFLDQIEYLGFKYATDSGFSIGIGDFLISDHKEELLEKIKVKEDELTEYFEQGLLTNAERRRLFEDAWLSIVDEVSKVTWQNYEESRNQLLELNDSGAVPVENPIAQISGVRGLIIDPSGKIVELPLRSNYKQGLSSLEYFVAARGTRKALADVALKTAESGYLTRKLVDVAQDVITRHEDCETTEGIYLNRADERRIDFVDRITGRWAAEEVKDKKGEVIVSANDEITPQLAERIDETEVDRVKVRSVLTCQSLEGVCTKCYGYSLGTRKKVEEGTAVGVIAAQAIGEASTQLTLDAKHRSGSATAKDITQGLPRIEELVEVRTPKAKSVLAEIDGTIKIEADEQAGVHRIIIKADKNANQEFDISTAKKTNVKRSKKVKKGDALFEDAKGNPVKAEFAGEAKVKDDTLILKASLGSEQQYEVDIWTRLLVEDGDKVTKGQQMTAGSIDPKELMELKGIEAAQKYIIDNVQDTFGVQGIGIDDKHVETMVKQMSRFMMVMTSGESDYLPGDYADHQSVEHINNQLAEKDQQLIKGKRMIMGLSNASLRTESFLSAASFQDQVRVLTEASLLGKTDALRGTKENVIIGRPVPLGDEVR
jgi:DNA-directed RNA polymerase subunit beta'